jgi:hypothetical protein
MDLNGEKVRILREMAMAYFKEPFQHLCGQTKENYKKPVTIAADVLRFK